MNDLPNYYMIKLTKKSDPTVIRFAEFQKYEKEAKIYWKQGKLLCTDVITGEWLSFSIANYDVEKMSFSAKEFKRDDETRLPLNNELDCYINERYKEALKKSKEAGEGVKKDKLCSIGVADGSAVYVITKVNSKTCRVEWRSFGGPDNWVDHRWGYQSTVPISQVKGTMMDLKY